MQVFVKKSDLSAAAAVIPVYAYFEDVPWVARNTFGDLFTPLSLPNTGITLAQQPIPGVPGPVVYQLASDWRSHAVFVTNGEAQRRILEVFSDYMQRNAMNDVNRSQALYGTTTITSWPTDAQSRYNEGQRGWAYVSQVRQTANGLATALPADPTDNSVWPAVIPIVYVPPT
jgi:S-formylglutathione hydrolase FrmB